MPPPPKSCSLSPRKGSAGYETAEACREFKPMPAEYQNPLASKDGLAPNKLTGPTELGVAARGSSGNAEEEGFPAGVNLSLHSAPSSAHLASGLFLGQQQE